jgi:hypothetical protein
MDLAQKLQLREEQRLAVAGGPPAVTDALGDRLAGTDAVADGVLVFVRSSEELAAASTVVEAARSDRLAWVAYPKGGALGTDLNRNRVVELLRAKGIQPVRQIAIDETWSALQFRPD